MKLYLRGLSPDSRIERLNTTNAKHMTNEPVLPSRRDIIKAAGGLAVGIPLHNLPKTTMNAPDAFIDITNPPNIVRILDAGKNELPIEKNSAGDWEGSGIGIQFSSGNFKIVPGSDYKENISHIQLRWHGDLHTVHRLLGDHWERSYGDLEWRGQVAGRTMPWYFLAYDGRRTHGYGLQTGPNAFCFWNADDEGISLWADIRSGGNPVQLKGRTLEVGQVICRRGNDGESPFAAASAFCSQMSQSPRIPNHTIYGTNDWNYAYGNNSAELIEGVAAVISELSPNPDNRPYSVIDDGWQTDRSGHETGEPGWQGNARFGDMSRVADRLKSLGVRPGLWFRALCMVPNVPDSWKSSRDQNYLDPSVPEVLDLVSQHIKRFAGWGYQMIKHDFSTWDILGLWGFEMGASPTRDGWSLADPTKTNAEVIKGLYHTIRVAAGDALLIGCNTVSHLSPGYHEIQRIGDDTSGRSWNRNRRMGVNTLAFRAVQDRRFYVADPDIVAITKNVPWNLVEQWLRLVSESGAALFVAIEPDLIEQKHRVALKKAFDIASRNQTIGQPLDWLDSDCPRSWNLRGETVNFDWMGEYGSWPFGD
jgi:alpha-galactosidase